MSSAYFSRGRTGRPLLGGRTEPEAISDRDRLSWEILLGLLNAWSEPTDPVLKSRSAIQEALPAMSKLFPGIQSGLGRNDPYTRQQMGAQQLKGEMMSREELLRILDLLTSPSRAR